jgi:hypothetical protein
MNTTVFRWGHRCFVLSTSRARPQKCENTMRNRETTMPDHENKMRSREGTMRERNIRTARTRKRENTMQDRERTMQGCDINIAPSHRTLATSL